MKIVNKDNPNDIRDFVQYNGENEKEVSELLGLKISSKIVTKTSHHLYLKQDNWHLRVDLWDYVIIDETKYIEILSPNVALANYKHYE